MHPQNSARSKGALLKQGMSLEDKPSVVPLVQTPCFAVKRDQLKTKFSLELHGFLKRVLPDVSLDFIHITFYTSYYTKQ